MKISKKLIAAIAMLTLSFVMLVTSSFAWFSMNTSVTANGMTVTAKADQVFLQISNTQTFSNTQSMITASAPEESKEATLLPTNVVEKLDQGVVTPYGAASAAKSTVAWVKNYSNSVEEADEAGEYSAIVDAEDYYLLNTFYLRLNPAAGQVTAANKLTSTVTLDGAPADALSKTVSVLVVCGEGENALAQLWKQKEGQWVNNADSTLTKENFANTQLEGEDATNASGPVAVKVYIFFDGDNDYCTTANAINLTGYSVTVSFSVK